MKVLGLVARGSGALLMILALASLVLFLWMSANGRVAANPIGFVLHAVIALSLLYGGWEAFRKRASPVHGLFVFFGVLLIGIGFLVLFIHFTDSSNPIADMNPYPGFIGMCTLGGILALCGFGARRAFPRPTPDSEAAKAT